MVDNLWKWVDNRSNDNDSLDLGDMTAAYSMYNKGRLTKAQAESVIHRMFEGWKLDPRDWEQN